MILGRAAAIIMGGKRGDQQKYESFHKKICSYINQVCPFEYTTKIIIQPIISLCFWVCFKHP